MIGHIFASSGAVCLALAPSAERGDEYIVLARTSEGDKHQYAVAHLLTAKMPEPDYWMSAEYPTSLDEAIEVFKERTGLAADTEMIAANVDAAEAVIAHRQALAR